MRRLLLLAALIVAGCGPSGPPLVHGKPVAHWLEVLKRPNALERRKAVQVLGNVGGADPAVLPALTGAVGDRDAGVRGEAVLALLKMGPPAREAAPALRAAEKDPDPRVRQYASRALERIEAEH
jgi:HEAT repeat protein